MGFGHRGLVLIAVALGFAAWIVALAGVSTLTAECYNNGQANNAVLLSCVKALQYQWWGVWFEFIVLSIVLGYAFVNNLQLHQSTLQALLATVTAVDMFIANDFTAAAGATITNAISGTTISALNCAAAGFIMFLVFNVFLIFVLGSGFVWFGVTDAYAAKGASAAGGFTPGPNFAAPSTFASPLSGGGARAYLPQSPA